MFGHGVAGSYGGSSSSFFKNLHTNFQSGCTHLHFQPQCVRITCFPHPDMNVLPFYPFTTFIDMSIHGNGNSD